MRRREFVVVVIADVGILLFVGSIVAWAVWGP